MHDSKWKSTLRRKMLNWFDENQRDLPWRKKKSPYRIWVSEIMLQQTQVATVIDYFNRFIKVFPTVKKLAAADESNVLKLWEGLGYYRRARQMHKAARFVVEKHGGKFPTDFESVLALPGIGRYTAGAILSISLDQRQPILEGNTIRLYSRLLEMRTDPRSTANQKVLWDFGKSILPRKRCGDFNQSLMELGSEICHPKKPQCLICPIGNICLTRVKGLQEQIPLQKKKMKYESLTEAVVIVERSGKFLVRKCGEGERWAGLWDFPRFEILDSNSSDHRLVSSAGEDPSKPKERKLKGRLLPVDSSTQLADAIKRQTGLSFKVQPTDHSLSHAVTRYKIKLDCYFAISVKGRLKKKGSSYNWVEKTELASIAMPGTGRKIAKYILENNPKFTT